jgi:hypothetical protein
MPEPTAQSAIAHFHAHGARELRLTADGRVYPFPKGSMSTEEAAMLTTLNDELVEHLRRRARPAAPPARKTKEQTHADQPDTGAEAPGHPQKR